MRREQNNSYFCRGLRGGEGEIIKELNLGISEISLECNIESCLRESGILLEKRKVEGEVSASEILIGKWSLPCKS